MFSLNFFVFPKKIACTKSQHVKSQCLPRVIGCNLRPLHILHQQTGFKFSCSSFCVGYKLKLIMPSNMTEERRAAMAAYGAELINVPAGKMEMARDLALEMQASSALSSGFSAMCLATVSSQLASLCEKAQSNLPLMKSAMKVAHGKNDDQSSIQLFFDMKATKSILHAGERRGQSVRSVFKSEQPISTLQRHWS